MRKNCKECKEFKDKSLFTKSKNVKDGYENKCKKCRSESRKIHGSECTNCGSEFKGGNLVAHHIKNYSEHDGLRIDLDNAITLCNDCHKGFHDMYGYRNNDSKQIKLYIEHQKAFTPQ